MPALCRGTSMPRHKHAGKHASPWDRQASNLSKPCNQACQQHKDTVNRETLLADTGRLACAGLQCGSITAASVA